MRLLVRTVQASIDQGQAVEETGPNPSRNMLQIVTLFDALKEIKVDAALGGARRDEEKARAKERFFSHRDRFGQWDPKNQRPELWHLFNGRKHLGEHFRVFPLSNWTELDVWQYIAREEVEIPNLYFTHQREVVDREGMLLARSAYITLMEGETYEERQVRFRTIGDMTCTGAVISAASTLSDIIQEVAAARPSVGAAPTTAARNRRWRTANGEGIFRRGEGRMTSVEGVFLSHHHSYILVRHAIFSLSEA